MAANAETRPAALRTRAGTGLALALTGCLLTTGAVAVVVHETAPSRRAIAAIVHALGVGLPIGLGLFRLSQRWNDRFAWLLVGTGLLFSLVTLAEADNSTLYSVGRVSAWVVEVAIVYLMLAFPLGRLTTTTERRIFRATLLVAVLLYLPTALMAPYPEPSPWATCGTDCPPNAFALSDHGSALVDNFIRPLREVLTIVIYGAVAGVLIRRARWSGALRRRALVPVAGVAVFRVLAMLAYEVLRALGLTGVGTEIVGWLYVLTLPVVTFSFAVGLLSQRLFVADALEHLTLGLKQHASANVLRTALGEALQDPSLRVIYWIQGEPGRWVDETGWPVKPPFDEPGTAVTEVMADGRRLAAITHDAALDPVPVQAAGSYALAALENERLVGQLNESLVELAGSRARIVAVAAKERRRIERDLHDGAQQRLVALRIKLELLADQLEQESPRAARAIRVLEDDIEETIDEVRSFARGIYPSLLAERGLSEALRAAGRGAPLPTTVNAGGLPRFRPEIEATVYFACMEALQNAAKHANGASGVMISVTQNAGLRFDVRDDGAGFNAGDVSYGAGLTNLRDRLEAVGGKLHVESAPGKGTSVRGVIPVSD
jgi:signal transduction histidine kinase